MSIGILLVTHAQVGEAMWQTACQIVGQEQTDSHVLSVPFDADTDCLFRQGCALIEYLDQGEGVIVLSDLYGATPANLASKICRSMAKSVAHISGLNLPLLLRLMNDCALPGAELSRRLLEGGREGIIIDVLADDDAYGNS